MTQTINQLFIYGTLAPGRPNEHILAKFSGTWATAIVKGHLRKEGWGAEMGYPGMVLDPAGDEINGFVFTTDDLDVILPELDAFEGKDYQRIVAQATLADGAIRAVYAYVLHPVRS